MGSLKKNDQEFVKTNESTSISKSLNISFETLEKHVNVIPPLSDYKCEEDIEKYIKKEELTKIVAMDESETVVHEYNVIHLDESINALELSDSIVSEYSGANQNENNINSVSDVLNLQNIEVLEMKKTAFSEKRDSKIEKLIQSQNIERVYLNKSESVVHEYSDKNIINPNKMANYSFLKPQIEINKNEYTPNNSGAMKEHLHVQSGYAYTDHPSAKIHSHSAHMVYYNKSKGEMTCSLKFQIETNKDETSPKISWGTKEHLHVQSGYAHTDLQVKRRK